jgi:O-succinylbenzoic acid--CoA ligase
MSAHALTDFGRRFLPPPLIEQHVRSLDTAAVTAGDRVGIIGRRDLDTASAIAATWRRGAVVVLISPFATEAARNELARHAGCAAVVDRDSISARRSNAAPAPDLALVVATSGSTGLPRLIAHDAATLAAAADRAAIALDYSDASTWYLSLPTHHIGGASIWIRAHTAGGEVAHPIPDESLVEGLRRTRATHVSLVPAQLADLLDADPPPPTLKVALVGGAPLSSSLRVAALGADIPLAVSYGATETAALVTVTRDPIAIARPESVGRPLPGLSVIAESDGTLRIEGAAYRGTFRDGEYHPRRPDTSGGNVVASIDTGDIGRVDEDGHVFVTGRRDTMFVCGGENVQPELIERKLLDHPDVVEVVVVPHAHDRLGQVPVAIVRAAPGAAPSSTDLAAFLAPSLPRFFMPRSWWRFPAPHGETLKASRDTLGERVAAGELEPL